MALALKYSCFSWLQKAKWRRLVSLLTDKDSTSTLGVCLRMDTSSIPGQVQHRYHKGKGIGLQQACACKFSYRRSLLVVPATGCHCRLH